MELTQLKRKDEWVTVSGKTGEIGETRPYFDAAESCFTGDVHKTPLLGNPVPFNTWRIQKKHQLKSPRFSEPVRSRGWETVLCGTRSGGTRPKDSWGR